MSATPHVFLRGRTIMIKSMTAYGRATRAVNGKNILVELKSVNSRFFDCNIKIPKAYGFLEEKIKTHIQTFGISRGKVDVFVGIEIFESVDSEIYLDEAYAQNYINALRKLRDTFELKDDISVMSVAQNRDIFTVIKPEEDAERDWAEVRPILDEALSQFTEMREKEGENLKADLLAKKRSLAQMADKVSALSKASIEGYRAKLEERLRKTLENLDIELDSARILTECAIFADKTAIDEELVRLSSHFKAFDEIFESNEPIGRKLDFLVQEINRETNTIGSKANDLDIASLVVEMKCEIEKIREQIQNLE